MTMNDPYRSEYGGLYGDNATAPDGTPRRHNARETAREVRRAGMADPQPPAER